MHHSTELTMLTLAVALGIVHLVFSATFIVAGRGVAHAVGPRDEPPPASIGRLAARFERAFRNYLETFAFFAVSVLVVTALGRSTPNSAIGAQMYLWARVLYVPAYISGIPFLRTICWTASMIGILMVLTACW
jgi:uncharacterized MAPEG superfamily protein